MVIVRVRPNARDPQVITVEFEAASPAQTGISGSTDPGAAQRGRVAVSDESAFRLGLREGAIVDGWALQEHADNWRAAALATRAIARRGYSSRELALTLVRRGVSERAVRDVTERFTRLGLLDDAAFARAYCRARIAGRGTSLVMLRRDLARKGVDRAVADAAVAAEFADAGGSERDIALRAARKKMKSLDRVTADVARRRLVQFLRRRGFGGDAVRYVLGELALTGAR